MCIITRGNPEELYFPRELKSPFGERGKSKDAEDHIEADNWSVILSRNPEAFSSSFSSSSSPSSSLCCSSSYREREREKGTPWNPRIALIKSNPSILLLNFFLFFFSFLFPPLLCSLLERIKFLGRYLIIGPPFLQRLIYIYI